MGFNFGAIGPWVRGLLFGFENGNYSPLSLQDGKLKTYIHGEDLDTGDPEPVKVHDQALYALVHGIDQASGNPDYVQTIDHKLRVTQQAPSPFVLANDSFTVATTAALTFGTVWANVYIANTFGVWVQNFEGGNSITGIGWKVCEGAGGSGVIGNTGTLAITPGNQFYLGFMDPVNYTGALPAKNLENVHMDYTFKSLQIGFMASVASPPLNITVLYRGR